MGLKTPQNVTDRLLASLNDAYPFDKAVTVSKLGVIRFYKAVVFIPLTDVKNFFR